MREKLFVIFIIISYTFKSIGNKSEILVRFFNLYKLKDII